MMFLGLFASFCIADQVRLQNGVITTISYTPPSANYQQMYDISLDSKRYIHTVIKFEFANPCGNITVDRGYSNQKKYPIENQTQFIPITGAFERLWIYTVNNTGQTYHVTFISYSSDNEDMVTFVSTLPNDVFTIGREFKSDVIYKSYTYFNYANLVGSNFSFRANAKMYITGNFTYNDGYRFRTYPLKNNMNFDSKEFALNFYGISGTVAQIKSGYPSYTPGQRFEFRRNEIHIYEAAPTPFDVESDLKPLTPSQTPSPEPYHPDHSDIAIGGLALACAIYFSIVMFLLVVDIILACIHPNRLYRSGFDCACFYCCCYNYYSLFGVYYSDHTYTPCFCVGCCNCSGSDCRGGDDKAVVIIFLVILLIILILMAFILLYLFFQLACAKDDEEREYERRYKDDRYGTMNQSMIDDSMSAPPMQPTSPPPGYYPQQGYPPQPNYAAPPQQGYPPQQNYYPPPQPATPYVTPAPPQQPYYQSQQKSDNPYADDYK